MKRLVISELVDKARAGDEAAFEELVHRTYVDSYTLAFRMLGNEDDARDVVQEVYLKAQKGIRSFRGDSKITTWLFRITANCANTYLSRHGKHKHEEMSHEVCIADEVLDRDPVHRANVVDLRSDITQALLELPYSLRSVIVLRDIYDLPHDKIAAELDITVTTAKVRLHRGRQKLRQKLSGLHADGDLYRVGNAHVV